MIRRRFDYTLRVFDGLPLPLLVVAFAAAAGVVWRAGAPLSEATDALDQRYGLGDALGGIILLALATNLPEIAITLSAALSGRVEVAVGNLLGGIAIQTLVLALLDATLGKKGLPLSARATSLAPALEGTLVIAVLGAVVLGTQLPKELIFLRVTPGGLLVVATWATGVWLVGKARKGLPWRLAEAPKTTKESASAKTPKRPLLTFAVAAGATLVAGYVLESTGDAAAKAVGMDGALFGATVLAAATSLPELATGLAAIRRGKEALAVGDILGGNAFLPTLFVLASLVSGRAVLPSAKPSDIFLTALGILVTIPYIFGTFFRSARRVGRLGIDSLVVLIVYALGMICLSTISR